jgi:hypothetical protein
MLPIGAENKHPGRCERRYTSSLPGVVAHASSAGNVLLAGRNRIPQDFCKMPSPAASGMLDLLPTRDAIGHQFNALVCCTYGGKESLVADVHRQLIVLGFVPK